MTIWKFPLTVTDLQQVSMPNRARILAVGNQGGTLMLWAMVNPGNPKESRTIEIIGTGNPISDDARTFIGTVQQPPFVWHVFERLV